jgi:sensor domain CHASE-containing protein/nitrogen-specific signal transduction histidine kinase
MKLYTKAFLILGTTGIVISIAFFVASQNILLYSFRKMEEQATNENVQRVLSAISSDVESLDLYTHDWSSWDDTYQFIQDNNSQYAQSNLMDDTFINAKLNLMLFINTSGQLVYGKAYDLQNMMEVPISQILVEKFGTNDILLYNTNESSVIKGFILLPEGPMWLVSRPILTSYDEGPAQGALVMGRFFDASQVARVSNETHLSIFIERLDDPDLPNDFQAAYIQISEENPIFVQPLNSETVSGYTLIKDIYGQPILILRINLLRNIYNQGLASVNFFFFFVEGFSLIIGILSIILVEKSLIAPLRRLSSNVTNIAKNGEISARVKIKGKDEVSDLAIEINKMLASLENSQIEIKESTKQLEQARLERLAVVGQAATMVGHDLRNPLQSITGASYILKEQFKRKLDNKSKEAFGIIDKGIGYSDNIINDLLDFSREIHLELEETNFRLFVQKILLEISIPENIQVLNQTQNELIIVMDPMKMKRVFSNLIKNAFDAMPQGGTLIINGKIIGRDLEISFTDTGTGIPLEVLAKIWTPFFTTKSKGLGLGLAICKRIVEAHEGRIFIESTVGKGTTFKIMLPIKPLTPKIIN